MTAAALLAPDVVAQPAVAVAAAHPMPPAQPACTPRDGTDKASSDDVAAQSDVRCLSDAELLATIFDGPASSAGAQAAAARLADVPRWQARQLGVEWLVDAYRLPRRWAVRLACLYELAWRHPGDDAPKVQSLDDALLVFEHLRTSRVEVAAVLPLDADRRPLGVEVVGMGTVNAVRHAIRDVLAPAVRADAVAMIYAHTHPSGDPRPSKADERFTDAMRLAADTVGVELLDHLVLAPRRSYSCADRRGWPTWTHP